MMTEEGDGSPHRQPPRLRHPGDEDEDHHHEQRGNGQEQVHKVVVDQGSGPGDRAEEAMEVDLDPLNEDLDR